MEDCITKCFKKKSVQFVFGIYCISMFASYFLMHSHFSAERGTVPVLIIASGLISFFIASIFSFLRIISGFVRGTKGENQFTRACELISNSLYLLSLLFVLTGVPFYILHH